MTEEKEVTYFFPSGEEEPKLSAVYWLKEEARQHCSEDRPYIRERTTTVPKVHWFFYQSIVGELSKSFIEAHKLQKGTVQIDGGSIRQVWITPKYYPDDPKVRTLREVLQSFAGSPRLEVGPGFPLVRLEVAK